MGVYISSLAAHRWFILSVGLIARRIIITANDFPPKQGLMSQCSPNTNTHHDHLLPHNVSLFYTNSSSHTDSIHLTNLPRFPQLGLPWSSSMS